MLRSLRHLRYYAAGAEVEVYTDHSSNANVKIHRKINHSKLLNWLAELATWQLRWCHIPGKENVVADWLSRDLCRTERWWRCLSAAGWTRTSSSPEQRPRPALRLQGAERPAAALRGAVKPRWGLNNLVCQAARLAFTSAQGELFDIDPATTITATTSPVDNWFVTATVPRA